MKNNIFPLIIIAGFILFILFASYAFSEQINIWYDRGDGNIVLLDSENNVVIGANVSTGHKLQVEGSFLLNGTSIFNDTITLNNSTSANYFNIYIDTNGTMIWKWN